MRSLNRLFKNRVAALALGFLLLELLCVLLLPPILQLEPNITDRAAGFWAPPSHAHPLGTDDVGRDLLARVVVGGRVSLLIGFGAAAISLLAGLGLGILAGYFRGGWEQAVMRTADVLDSFPSVILILALTSLFGASAWGLALLIGLRGAIPVVRLVYANTLVVREGGYIAAAHAAGMPTWKILLRHVVPNAAAPAWAALPLRVGRSMLTESSLSFLGFGVRAPQASWGGIIGYASGLSVLAGKPWVWVPPGLCIIATVLCCQLAANGLRAALDTKGQP